MAIAAPSTFTQPKIGVRRYLGDIFWATRIIAAAAILLAAGKWPTLWHQLVFLIGMAVLIYPVRSVRWGTVYNLFLLGAIFSLLIIGVQYLIEVKGMNREHDVFRSVVIAAVTEELLKIAPLVILLSFPRLPFRYAYGASDLMICGAALGAGFGYVEFLFGDWQVFPVPATPRIFGFPIFNDSFWGFIGHGGSTALIGLTIGWLMYALRWKKFLMFGWLAVGLATYWMMVDHGLGNYQQNVYSDDWPAPVRWMWTLDRRGTLSPYVALILILATMLVERVLLWRVLRPLPRARWKQCGRYIIQPLRSGLSYGALRTGWMNIRRLLLYVLAFRQIGNLVLHLRGDRPMDRKPLAGLIVRRTAEVAFTQLAVRRA